MKRKVTMVVIAMLLVTGVTSGMAIAQNKTETTEQPKEESNIIKIDEVLTITDYEFENGKVTVWIEADYSTMIVLSSMTQPQEGAQNIPRKSVTLDKGINKVTMNVETFEGWYYVTVASSDGAIAISEERKPSGIDYTFESEQFVFGSIISFLGGVALVAFVTLRKRDKYDSEPEELDL